MALEMESAQLIKSQNYNECTEWMKTHSKDNNTFLKDVNLLIYSFGD